MAEEGVTARAYLKDLPDFFLPAFKVCQKLFMRPSLDKFAFMICASLLGMRDDGRDVDEILPGHRINDDVLDKVMSARTSERAEIRCSLCSCQRTVQQRLKI